MELNDNWYRSKQICSINYRPLKPGSNLVVETVRFNPSVCTCGKQCSEPHYRVESRVINVADRVDINDSVAIYDEQYSSNIKSNCMFINDKDAKVNISNDLSQSKSSKFKSDKGAQSTDNGIVSKSAFTGSLTIVDVNGDGCRVSSIEKKRRIMSDVKIGDVKISSTECVDDVIGNGDTVNIKSDADVEEFSACKRKHIYWDTEIRSDLKSETGGEFFKINKVDVIDDGKVNTMSVKNGNDGGQFNDRYGEIIECRTADYRSTNNGSECGHFNEDLIYDVTENDSSVENSGEVLELNVRKAEYQYGVIDDISGVEEDSGECEDIASNRKDDDVKNAIRSCMKTNDDHDINVVDDVTASEEIYRGSSAPKYTEDISAAFGIMSVYCNSELHSTMLEEW